MYIIICKRTLSIWLLLFNYFISQGESLVIPQELPSLLSLVYSNIPPIKKGTDSRLGFGFRLGEHADFQILVELGPQKETRPIGDSEKNEQSYNKREVLDSQKFLETISRTNLSDPVKAQLFDLTLTRKQAIKQLHKLYKMAKSSAISTASQPMQIPDERI